MKRLVLLLLLVSMASLLFADTVLVATERTRYKRNLVEALVDKLESAGFTVNVIDHQRGELDNVDPGDYTAVFITNSGAQARVRPEVLAWLDKVRSNDDNVILHTTQITDWDPPVEVDSITSASQNSNIDDLSDDIVSRIRALM